MLTSRPHQLACQAYDARMLVRGGRRSTSKSQPSISSPPGSRVVADCCMQSSCACPAPLRRYSDRLAAPRPRFDLSLGSGWPCFRHIALIQSREQKLDSLVRCRCNTWPVRSLESWHKSFCAIHERAKSAKATRPAWVVRRRTASGAKAALQSVSQPGHAMPAAESRPAAMMFGGRISSSCAQDPFFPKA